MLRQLHQRDGPRLGELMRRNFPDEERILGTDPRGVQQVVERVLRWDTRLVLGLLELFGRPTYRFFVIEEDRQLAATALLTFTKRAGYVSMVMVDTPFRRRGFAKRVMGACLDGARRARRRYLVLDVLTENAPARALYDQIGFRPLRETAYMTKPLAGTAGSLAADVAGVRSLARRDGNRLVQLRSAELPPNVAEVLPAEREQFFVPSAVVRGLQSTTAAWVLEEGGEVQGFLRGTVSPMMEAGNLTAPLLAPSLSEDRARAFLLGADAWLASHGAIRAVTEVPTSEARTLGLLRSVGYTESFRTVTMSLPLHA